MEELLKAMQMFQTGVQQGAATYALNDASAAMEHINTQVTDEGQKRAMQQQLGQALALKLASVNASPDKIKTAFAAITPPEYATPDAAITEGYLSNKPGLVKGGELAQENIQQKQMRQFAAQEQYKMAADDRRAMREQQNIILKAGLDKKNEASKLTADEIKAITNTDSMLDSVKTIAKMVNEDKSLIGPIIPRFGATNEKYQVLRTEIDRLNKAYQLEVTGQGLSNDERISLEKMLPNTSDTETKFLAKLKGFEAGLRRVQERRISNMAKAGKNVTNFIGGIQAEKALKAQQDATSSVFEESQ